METPTKSWINKFTMIMMALFCKIVLKYGIKIQFYVIYPRHQHIFLLHFIVVGRQTQKTNVYNISLLI